MGTRTLTFCISLCVLVVILVFPSAVFGGETIQIERLTNIPGLTNINSPNFQTFFNNLYRYGIGLAGTLAVIMIMWWGFRYMTSETPFNVSQSRDRLLEIFIGLLLLLSPVIVFSVINPTILNLDPTTLFQSLGNRVQVTPSQQNQPATCRTIPDGGTISAYEAACCTSQGFTPVTNTYRTGQIGTQTCYQNPPPPTATPETGVNEIQGFLNSNQCSSPINTDGYTVRLRINTDKQACCQQLGCTASPGISDPNNLYCACRN